MPESPVIAVNQTFRLFVTLSTTALQNSSLSVDFGDGSFTTAALQPGVALAMNSTPDASNDVSVHDRAGGLVKISHDNYGSTCQLRVELSHIYAFEGDFNVSVVVHASRIEETIMARNWTLAIVRRFIEEVSVLVDSVVTVQRNVTVEAFVSPVSLFLKYHWTVLDVADRTNISVVLLTTTNVPHVQLILVDVGDYLINVTVGNEVSSATDSVIITASVPISALSLSCDNNSYFLINAKFDCVATVRDGTDVGFMWDFDAGNSVHVTSGNSSSVATVVFPAVGKYNVTVTAWNNLNMETVWQAVDIAGNVFKLITLATTEPAVVGRPVNVTVCSVQAANLTVEFDFVGGTHQLVLNSELRVVTASHVYLHPGSHAVTVKAESSTAMEAIHATVTVLERIPDADIKPMSELVTGRRSVFMAIFSGNFVCFSNFVLRCFTYLV